MTDPTATPQSPADRLLTRLAWAMLIAAVAGCGLLALARIGAQTASPFDLDYAEPYHVWSFMRVAGPEPVVSGNEPPYTTLPYPPGGYLVYGAVSTALGDAHWHTHRTAARLLTALCTLAATLGVVVLARTLGAGWRSSLLGALLYLSADRVHQFAVNPRPDALAAALTLLSVSAMLRGRAWLAGALAGGMLIVKYALIVGPGLMGLRCLWRKDWAGAAKYAAGGLIALAVALAISPIVLGKGFADGLAIQSPVGLKWGQSFNLTSTLIFEAIGPILGGFAVLACPKLPEKVRWITLAFVAAVAFHALALAKPGAAFNYFLEPVGYGAALSAWGLTQLARHGTPTHQRAVALAGCVALTPVAVSLLWEAQRAAEDLRLSPEQVADDPRSETELIALLSQVEGPVITPTASVAMQAGHEVWIAPDDLVKTAFQFDLWDDDALTRMIADRAFGAVARTYALSNEARDLLEINYPITVEVAGETIYLRDPPPPGWVPPHVDSQDDAPATP
ncbi:MAG: glycosyltransferase 87 family protein [Planctomycetota bacterium]